MATRAVTQRMLLPIHQVPSMKHLYPQFSYSIRRGAVVWSGFVIPTDASRTYFVRIFHKPNKSPNVQVVEPKLVTRADGGAIPHLYSGGYLCLYHPGKREWHPGDLIAHTIVPWTSLWLYYYELWHAVGKWLGGGEHPTPQERRRR
jgi:hypothetical protein